MASSKVRARTLDLQPWQWLYLKVCAEVQLKVQLYLPQEVFTLAVLQSCTSGHDGVRV